jgi:hypothetical protein
MKGGRPYIRLEGDKERAELLLRRARAELQRTKSVAARMGVADYQRMVKVDQDSYIITKVFRGGLEVINIYAAPYVPREVITEEEKPKFPKPEKRYSIYSGLVCPGWMEKVVDPETQEDTWPVMQQFNPTKWCRKTNPSDFDKNLDFQDVPRLAVERAYSYTSPQAFGWYNRQVTYPPNGARASQYNAVRACSFTGLMAKAVSIISGYGNFNVDSTDEYDDLLYDVRDTAYTTKVKTDAFQILYDSRFTRCHSITKGSDGNLWLVETSVVNGVIAMPLKYLAPYKFNNDVNQDWPVSQAFTELGGLPSGETFPQTRNEVELEIIQGRIIQLMSPTEYGAILTDDWNEYSEDNCWAWNEDGTEGRVTAFRYYKGDINVRECGYFSISITIGNLNSNPPSVGSPVGSGTATITPIHPPELIIAGFRPANTGAYSLSVPPEKTYPGSTFGRGTRLYVPVTFYQRETDTYGTLSISTTKGIWDQYEGELKEIMEAVIWVGYINGEWEELKFKQHKDCDLEYYYYNWVQPNKDFSAAGGDLWNVAILCLKQPSTGVHQWNPYGLPIIHWGHVYSSSDISYNESNYTKDYVGMRWASIDSWAQIGSWNFTSGWSNSSQERFRWINLHVDEDTGEESFSPVFDGSAYSTLHCFEFTYSQWWTKDFPELLSDFVIPPHNRSAYYYYEHEYHPRRDGPFHSDENDPSVYTSCGTKKFRIRFGSGKGIKITSELPVGTSGINTLTVINVIPDTSYSIGYLYNPETYTPLIPTSFSGDISDPNNYWSDTGTYTQIWVGIDHPHARIVQEQAPNPFTYNHPGHKVWDVHPNDFEDGYLNKCGEWHNRVQHITTDYGERPYGYKSVNFFTEGIVRGYVYEYTNFYYLNGEVIPVVWYPTLMAGTSPPASHCQPFGSTPPGPASIDVPECWLPDEGPTHTIADTYSEWRPYLTYRTYLVCDRIGKINFQAKTLYSNGENEDSDLADLYSHLTAQNRHCQHAVIGEPAVVYSDLDIQNNKGLGYYGIKAQGTMPKLPDTNGDDEYLKFITFIGVNSE